MLVCSVDSTRFKADACGYLGPVVVDTWAQLLWIPGPSCCGYLGPVVQTIVSLTKVLVKDLLSLQVHKKFKFAVFGD